MLPPSPRGRPPVILPLPVDISTTVLAAMNFSH